MYRIKLKDYLSTPAQLPALQGTRTSDPGAPPLLPTYYHAPIITGPLLGTLRAKQPNKAHEISRHPSYA